jgi:hypothetical protein
MKFDRRGSDLCASLTFAYSRLKLRRAYRIVGGVFGFCAIV